MRVLLVEPAYKNKYPPMGLMKISTYHRERGDTVRFYKGCMEEKELLIYKPDKVYITSLFTFYYKKVTETLEYYRKYIKDDDIFLGGIMVTILYNKIYQEVKQNNLLKGLLEDSYVLGYGDHINIDQLPLDYDILDQIAYDYPASGNYFAYTTRGCPNHCSFCAVPILEPEFHVTNNIYNQIKDVNRKYGEKRNLLLLDNNIFNLNETELQQVVDDMKKAGFTKDPTFVKEDPFELFIRKSEIPFLHDRIVKDAVNYLKGIKIKGHRGEEYKYLLDLLESSVDKKYFLRSHKNWIRKYISRRTKTRKLKRYVDFNQGLEAARLTPTKMKILSQLPLRPVRIAFDHYNQKATENYKRAVGIAASFGIKEFSNYMLYNFNDRPEDLWYRIKINIELSQQLGISMFSFPMKYMPITETDRKYIGKYWNRKYLQSIPAILIITKGVVADGPEFFDRAFGRTVDEFFEILAMPKDFIIYRKYFEDKGLAQIWKSYYDRLSVEDKGILIKILSEEIQEYDHDKFENILKLYGRKYRYIYLKEKEIES